MFPYIFGTVSCGSTRGGIAFTLDCSSEVVASISSVVRVTGVPELMAGIRPCDNTVAASMMPFSYRGIVQLARRLMYNLQRFR